MQTVQIIGIIASIGSAVSLLPQLIKIQKEKKAEGLSVKMLIIFFATILLWTFYGILKNDFIIIISNCVSLAINIAITILTFKYKKNA